MEIRCDDVIRCFQYYMDEENTVVPRQEFLANLDIRLQDSGFCSDMAPLLRAGLAYDVQVAGSHVREALIMRLSA